MVPHSDLHCLPESTPNPSLPYFTDDYGGSSAAIGITSIPKNGFNSGTLSQKRRAPVERRCALLLSFDHTSRMQLISFLTVRYFANTSHIDWPPEVREYNRKFTKTLETIKRRHDPTVTTVAQGVLEWKRSQNARNISLDVQHWLDRFYLSRIGIRFLIGQRARSSCSKLWLSLGSAFLTLSLDIALNTLQPHPDYVGIICTSSVWM